MIECRRLLRQLATKAVEGAQLNAGLASDYESCIATLCDSMLWLCRILQWLDISFSKGALSDSIWKNNYDKDFTFKPLVAIALTCVMVRTQLKFLMVTLQNSVKRAWVLKRKLQALGPKHTKKRQLLQKQWALESAKSAYTLGVLAYVIDADLRDLERRGITL